MMQRAQFSTGRLVLLALCTAIGLSGCDSGSVLTYRVVGKVTFPDGTPLAGGWVEFKPVDSEHRVSARGQIHPDGTFELGTFEEADGAIVGKHQAVVVPPLPKGDRDEMRVVPQIIDEKFRRFDTSGLKFTVTPEGPNEFSIEVERP